MRKISLLFIIAFSTFLIGCSSTEESVKKESEPEIYIFDDVENVDTTKIKILQDVPKKSDSIQTIKEKEIIEQKPRITYALQLGAFTSKERAEAYVNENQSKLHFMMLVSFNDAIGLFVVKLPPLQTKEEAEKLRNQLWQIPTFKDAFIVTEVK
ncbi:MAG: SPOR domain-containing protein [Ignavibacteria bacterium]|nr:SPOR domain-containing protein [Ignavibacteria bacterium]